VSTVKKRLAIVAATALGVLGLAAGASASIKPPGPAPSPCFGNNLTCILFPD